MNTPHPATLGAAAALSCACTLALTAVGVPSVVASALATLLLAGLLPKRAGMAPAVFMGSFAGMTSLSTLSAPLVVSAVVALCASAAAVFALSSSRQHNPWWAAGRGVGGRLGTLAFIASLPVGLFAATGASPLPHADVLIPTMALLGAVGAVVPSVYPTRWMVRRTAIAGLAGGALLALFPPLAGAWYTGCFVSMSDADITPGTVQRAVAGAMAGLMYAGLCSWLPVVGGSMGLAALLAVLVTHTALAQLGLSRHPAR